MNCYEILGIPPNADLKDVNSAYKRLALKYHPDKTGADDAHLEFQKVQYSHNTLSRIFLSCITPAFSYLTQFTLTGSCI